MQVITNGKTQIMIENRGPFLGPLSEPPWSILNHLSESQCTTDITLRFSASRSDPKDTLKNTFESWFTSTFLLVTRLQKVNYKYNKQLLKK